MITARLGKPGPHLPVFQQALPQAIQAFGIFSPEKLYNLPVATQPAEAFQPEKSLTQADALISIILRMTHK